MAERASMDTLFTMLFLLIFMIVLIFLSGWFSGSETALTNLTAVDIANMERRKDRNVRYIIKLKKRMDRTLITILIGNNLVNILLSSVAALVANELFAEIGVSVMIGVITFLVIVFGEITPKNSAIFDSTRVAGRNARAIYYLSMAIYPLVSMFRWISTTIIKLTGGKEKGEALFASDESIRDLAALSEREGNIKPIEKKIIDGVFKFGDRKVRDTMVPMDNVFCLDDDMGLEGIKASIKEHGFTRVPVMGDDHRVKGILYSKDLLMISEEDIPSVIRKPFTVGDHEDLTDVFDRMRKERVHLAIVENEKGEHTGVITLEDLLEELVGELHDEYFEKKYSRYKLKDYS
ncbi:MAG: hypothetical protein DRN57_01860 [Thermoplasmata archaeon]|nr:MAG: hypothetical protein DRN57_01860 [Thermoplasmata archaeon]